MNLDELQSFLDDTTAATAWLQKCGIQDAEAGHKAFHAMVDQGLTLDLMSIISEQLEHALPKLGDADLALATLARFFAASRSPLALVSLIEQDKEWLSTLLQLFSTSEMLGELLVQDPAAYDLLRLTEGQPIVLEALQSELRGEISGVQKTDDAMALLRVFKRRETLRIAYGDIVRDHDARIVSDQLSILAEVICDVALEFILQKNIERRGQPTYGSGGIAQLAMVGLGRLGGGDLDYGDEIDALFLYDFPGRTNGERPIENQEFFEKVVSKTIQLLGEETVDGVVYNLNVRRATAFSKDRLCGEVTAAVRHFDTRGRTWERMSLIKARPVAGERSVGFEFLDAIEPWVYRRYLSRSDISGMRALKRRLVRRSDRHGLELLDVEGGVRDVEFVVRFLQLINGGDDRQIHVGNTFQAIGVLEQSGAITETESQTLDSNYRWLRRVEHRLEVMHSPSTHMLPNRTDELRRLAVRCGFDRDNATDKFREEYRQRTNENQGLVSHLLNDALDEEVMSADAETDLVMDPDPRPETIRNILSPYRFRDPIDAYHNIEALGRERIPFLSTRRCRHFLSLIARPLLRAIAATPSPDATLANLVRVSDSLGGKGVLWELFKFRPASLDLYVRLCSSSPYLTAILTRYPGMIDELLDSLQLAKLPSLGDLQNTLDELCSGLIPGDSTDQLNSILHGFKNTQHLSVGVRELLGKVDIRDSTTTLSHVAEACLQRIAHDQHRRLIRKFGEPRVETQPCGYVILGMGKLGGREPNYHSDLDFVVLYEDDGETYHPPTIRHKETTTNRHFFGELSKRIVRAISENSEYGKLYDSEQQIRPIGMAGPSSVSLSRFRDHYLDQPRPFRELRKLCRARPVYGSESLRASAAGILKGILTSGQTAELDSASVHQLRMEIQADAGPRNLKRGPGGTLDVEFITQVLQLREATKTPEVLSTNTLDSLAALAAAEVLEDSDAKELVESYRFLRKVEAMLRLLNTTARHDLPREKDELNKLSYLMRFRRPSELEEKCHELTTLNRQLFEKLM